jgi:hypothetical protein
MIIATTPTRFVSCTQYCFGFCCYIFLIGRALLIIINTMEGDTPGNTEINAAGDAGEPIITTNDTNTMETGE